MFGLLTFFGRRRTLLALLIIPAVEGVLLQSTYAQNLKPTIVRLPTALYLPRVSGGAIDLATDKHQIKDLAGLKNTDSKPFSQALNAGLTTSAAKNFIQANAKELGIEGSIANFPIVANRQTLSGKYISLEQRVNGLRVVDGGIQIKVGDDGSVQSVTRNVVSVPVGKSGEISKVAKIDANAAQDIAWRDLGVTGELLESPQIEKVYVNEQNVLTLTYVVRLSVSKPFGYWEHRIDASTGRILSKFDRRIQEQKRGYESTALVAVPSGPGVSFSEAVKLLKARDLGLAEKVEKSASATTSGSAIVFALNPITMLRDSSLQNGDPPARFESAYKKVSLDGLRRVNGKLTLNGSTVRIEDFEPGENGRRMSPSTADVEWVARRGTNAFNDVTTYYHVSSSLAYLRKLGYQGAADLFPKGISVDTDGVNGEDNSHYVPGADRLAFGHGCVDDNEDSDVIQHELGHAIHFHINQLWGGGDSGAIGEGFGDYWAVSTRLRAPNGWTYLPGKVFLWDGSDACWGGRRVDRTNARYDPLNRYGAHESLNGFISDELWATPLVSSLLELVQSGESVESVDIAVLEGMEGIGPNFTMRSLALRTVDQARLRYPGKPHARVLEKHFRLHQIIE